mgnify:CR=1 FL=1
MSPRLDFGRDTRSGFPRVSGDEPKLKQLHGWFGPFSPRERG